MKKDDIEITAVEIILVGLGILLAMIAGALLVNLLFHVAFGQ